MGFAVLAMYLVTESRRLRGATPGSSWVLAAKIGGTLWALTLVVPFDVSFKNVPGPPRFVPYELGLPGPEAVARAKRGDAVLGGCVSTGFEPHWVWVW